MLDIKRIRENPDEVKNALARRNKDWSAEIDSVLRLDGRKRELLQNVERCKAAQNAATKKIPELKRAGADVSELMAEMKSMSDEARKGEEELKGIEDELNALLPFLPNTPNPEIPDGKDSEDNLEVRRWGEPRVFGFEALPHWELGEKLGILDPARAAKVTGARFHFYTGLGAKLERAIINLYLDTHAKAGYTEVWPPLMINRASMTGTGQLPKFEEDAFAVKDTDYFMTPTAEVPVTNYHRDEILDMDALPISYCSYTPCFRAEAGSAGRDTRGLIRQHQFNKVELVKFSRPEDSYEQLEKLTADAERVLQLLGLPYRVVCLCTGDLGNSSAKTYDIEVWMPSYGRYVEISSCSNFEDYQARRANIRCREGSGKPIFSHTLNGSGVAVGRTTAAILENYQREDGGIVIPEVLRAYIGAEAIEL